MVPAATILETAKREQVDLIGLSGLITPSLDEMAFVASELERNGFTTPLLIGGATTSRAHTAIRIEPQYSQPVVHVLDASRAVPVASALRDPARREEFAASIRTEYEAVRREREGEHIGNLVTVEEARASRISLDLSVAAPRPRTIGVQAFDDWSIADIRTRIDWTPFFRSWELKGSWPSILDDPAQGEAARDLFRDAQAILDELEQGGTIRARGVIGFWPADATGDDIALYHDEARTRPLATLHMLRQQARRADDRPCNALSDFVAPRDAGVPDYVGAFAVTTGHGLEPLVLEAKAKHDDYRAIMLAAMTDRLAEAFAERLHEKVRQEYWGYAVGESLDNAELIREKYQGIRPAPGYPACPDHTEKFTLMKLLDAEPNAGIVLTDSCAMIPGAAVSGWYFWRPESRYFGVGRIGRDQVEDYARRKGWDMATAERWLSANLGYRRGT